MITQNRDKPWLVLLPGRMCDARLFRAQIAGLGDIADIFVGDVTRHDRFEDIAAHVLAHAPKRFDLAGLSLGGIVAMEIMRQAPERVTNLALLDTNPGTTPPEKVAESLEHIRLAQTGRYRELCEIFYDQMVHSERRRDARLKAEVMGMALATGADVFVRQTQALLHRRAQWDTLATISCPTLLLGGRQDEMCPPKLHAQMSATIPYANLEIIENCGHLSTLERPAEVTEILRSWLRGYPTLLKANPAIKLSYF
jgi:pimeloyl-ACP methyl ester carboxylesterase